MKPVFLFVLLAYSALAVLACLLPAEKEPPAARILVPADTTPAIPGVPKGCKRDSLGRVNCPDYQPPAGPR